MMTDYFEFCDCYHCNHHSEEAVPCQCEFCEKMERMFHESSDEAISVKEFCEEEPAIAANF